MEKSNVTKPKSFDLSTLDTVAASNAGTDIELFHPATNEDLGITITVLGRDSAEFKRVQTEQSRRRMSKMQKSGSYKATAIPASEMEQDSIDLLASCTKGWKNLAYQGADLPFSFDNAVMIYAAMPWIREQIDQAVSDRANFIKG